MPVWSFPIPGGDHDSDHPEGVGLVLARPHLHQLFFLNPSASSLWRIFVSNSQKTPATTSPSDLAVPFAALYGIPLDTALADVTATLESWTPLLSPNDDDSPNEADDDDPEIPHSATPPSPHLAPNVAFSLGDSANFFIYLKPDADAEIRPRLAHLPAPIPNAPHNFHFHLLSSPADPAILRVRLLQAIARLAANPANPPQYAAILHAAALAHPTTNRALILPAATGAGKSTLTTFLSHTAPALRLLSDDSAALTVGHALLSLPFAVMLRSGSWPVLAPHLPANAIDACPIHHRYGEPIRFLPPPSPISLQPAIPNAIVFPQYSPSHPEPSLTRLAPFDALCALQSAGFWLPHTQPAIQAFLDWFFSITSYQFLYSDLEKNTIAILHNLLANHR